MKNCLVLSLLLFTLSAPVFCAAENGGSEKYRATMQKYIHLVDTATTEATMMRAANSFERIAAVEAEEWLPKYYAAYSYLNMAMGTKDLDLVDVYCDKALHLIALAGDIAGADESELLCLASLAAVTRIRVDVFLRGMEYSAKAENLLREAGKANPVNPRVSYLQARLVIGRPKQFGGGLEAGLPKLREAAEKFDHQPHPAESLLPDWGRKRTAEILAAVAEQK